MPGGNTSYVGMTNRSGEVVTYPTFMFKTLFVLLNTFGVAMTMWFLHDYGKREWGLDRYKFEQYISFTSKEKMLRSFQIIGLLLMTAFHTVWLMEEFGEWYSTYRAYSLYSSMQRQQMMQQSMGYGGRMPPM